MLNKEVIEIFEKLMSWQGSNTIRFPASIAYAVMRNIKTLQPIYEDIIAARADILQTYASPVEDQPGYFLPKEGQQEAMEHELTALAAINNSIDIVTIPMTALDGLELTLEDMDVLYFMVDG